MNTTQSKSDPFGARDTFDTGSGRAGFVPPGPARAAGSGSCVPAAVFDPRAAGSRVADVRRLRGDRRRRPQSGRPGTPRAPAELEIPFKPARVVLQDFTGVPAVVDLAAMRTAMQRLGGDPKKINPLIPVDLVIDHSVQVDYFGTPDALRANVDLEFERNRERYEFLRWGQQAFQNFRAVPPNVGIVHQVNLEFLAKGVFLRDDGHGPGRLARHAGRHRQPHHDDQRPGRGRLGRGRDRGRGGDARPAAVHADAGSRGLRTDRRAAAGRHGHRPGADRDARSCRKEGVVGKFVEFFGPGVSRHVAGRPGHARQHGPRVRRHDGLLPGRRRDAGVPAAHRADRRRRSSWSSATPRSRGCSARTTRRCRSTPRRCSWTWARVEPSLAGPKRPQDRVPLAQMKAAFRKSLRAPVDGPRASPLDEAACRRTAGRQPRRPSSHDRARRRRHRRDHQLHEHQQSVGDAGRRAAGQEGGRRAGCGSSRYVKTSLAPGSRVVSDYLDKAGLTEPLEQLGFHTVGYGCTTCIGNSGPLPEPVAKAVDGGRPGGRRRC